MNKQTPYHYTESGLDDVWLLNGFILTDGPYGRGVSIEDLDGLHATIGARLAQGAASLSPKEVRFLRHELDLSQVALAALLGVDAQTVARWEKPGQTPIPGPAERLLRAIYLQQIDGAPSFSQLLDDLAKLDTEIDGQEMLLEFADSEWQSSAA